MAEPFLICPKNWLRGTLEPDATKGLIDRVDSGSTPSTGIDEYWDGDIPWLTPKEITDVRPGFYVYKTERMITAAGVANSSARLLPPNTVLLTKRAPVGAVAINAVPMATNQGFLSFRCGPKLRPLYFAYWLQANRPYLELVANGSTYPEIYTGDLFEFELSVPDIDRQDRILEFISAFQFVSLLGGSLEQAAESPEEMLNGHLQAQRLLALKDQLLPLLLCGRLSVEAKDRRPVSA